MFWIALFIAFLPWLCIPVLWWLGENEAVTIMARFTLLLFPVVVLMCYAIGAEYERERRFMKGK